MGKPHRPLPPRRRAPATIRLCVLANRENEAAQAAIARHKLTAAMLTSLQGLWAGRQFRGLVHFPLTHSIADVRSTAALVRRGLVDEFQAGMYRLNDAGLAVANQIFCFWWESEAGTRLSQPQHFTGEAAADDRRRLPAPEPGAGTAG